MVKIIIEYLIHMANVIELDKYLANKAGLYNNYLNRTSLDIIVRLGCDFNYTKSHFDKFITQITYKKSLSYLPRPISKEITVRNHNNIVKKSNPIYIKKQQVLTIMFSKFLPDKKQMKRMISCYETCYYKDFEWVSIIIKKGYKFTEHELNYLLSVSCPLSMILSEMKKDNNTLKYLIYNGTTPKDIYTYIETNNIQLDNKDVEVLLKLNLNYNKLYKTRNNKTYTNLEWWSMIQYIINKINTQVSFEDIKILIKNYINDTNNDNKKLIEIKEDVIKNIFDNNNINEDILLLVCTYGSFTLIKQVFKKGIEKGIKISTKYLDLCISSEIIDKLKIINYLTEFGLILTDSHLELCCKLNEMDSIILLCNKYSLGFSQKCLEYACYHRNKDLIIKILNNKLIPNEDCLIALFLQECNKETNAIITQLMHILLEFDGHITIKVIEYAAMSGIFLECFKNSKVSSEEIYNIYHNYNMISLIKYGDLKINEHLFGLRKICLSSSLDIINRYIKTYNLKLDIYCLENMCMNIRSSPKEIKLIIDTYNIIPTLLCLHRLSYANGKKNYWDDKYNYVINKMMDTLSRSDIKNSYKYLYNEKEELIARLIT